MSDRRLTPANGRVAHVSLRGSVTADRFVPGEPARIAVPLADLLAAPNGARDRQVLMGDAVLVLDRHQDHAFVRADKDGYCGYVQEAALGDARPATHWVSVPATHVYAAPDIKTKETSLLSLGARLSIAETGDRFARTVDGDHVLARHLLPIGKHAEDPAAIAELFLGTPYLWGGNSRSGIDCSGLAQAALLACGIPCPGDSDLQAEGVGVDIAATGPFRRNDLLFWKGHVAIALGQERMIHATGHYMAVVIEGIHEAIGRIAAQGGGPVIRAKRIVTG
ncbi:C40 family peptidase [Defluviimonas sp. WL0002]|uniref:C40 family peptidase n=1 Tax=Albidovulum marisflavi TaxID=2984159 RepID=A0ABT2Z9D0_9RHOB|nr:C40 family peptidase [Defluviimonas sp. WL0002]MCV2867625.1 C40 family peptidase [Defluviimonas sp. WL0002]